MSGIGTGGLTRWKTEQDIKGAGGAPWRAKVRAARRAKAARKAKAAELTIKLNE